MNFYTTASALPLYNIQYTSPTTDLMVVTVRSVDVQVHGSAAYMLEFKII